MRRGRNKQIEYNHQHCTPWPAAVCPYPQLAPQTPHPPQKHRNLPNSAPKPTSRPLILTPRRPPAPPDSATQPKAAVPQKHLQSLVFSSLLLPSPSGTPIQPSVPRVPMDKGPTKFSAPLRVLRGQKAVLLGPSWTKALRSSPRPSASSADKKVLLTPLHSLLAFPRLNFEHSTAYVKMAPDFLGYFCSQQPASHMDV